jgi:hypothetical protein
LAQIKLASHHLATAKKILTHPVSHNIAWHDVISLITEVGSVTEEANHRFTVTIGTETRTFDRPRGDDIDEQQVVDLRRMLGNVGITADSLVQ